MSGDTQSRTLTDIWVEAQKQIWESWSATMQAASASASFYPDLVEQWRKLATYGLEAWTAIATPPSQNASRQLLAAQAATIRFLEFSIDAWKAMAPRLEAGEDWQSILRHYTEQFTQQLVHIPAGMLAADQNINDLWKLYLAEIENVVKPWINSLHHKPDHLGEALLGGGSELVELTNLYWDAYERTFGRLVESPRMGFTRELDEKLLRGFDAWTDFRRASLDYQLILADIWSRVFEKVMHELVALNAQGKSIQGLRDLLRLWTDVADRELETAFQSEAYVAAQARLFNVTMQYRLREQAIMETYLKMSYIPTRSEVDEVHRSIYELRKEVKALKKALRASRNGAADPPSEPAPRNRATSAPSTRPSPEPKPARRKRAPAPRPPDDTGGEA